MLRRSEVNGGKKIKGRKHHIIVDHLGLLLAIFISRADMHDGEGGVEMLWQLKLVGERLGVRVLGDGALVSL
ncbi:MAG: transposase [Bacteroidia bacterium]